MKYLILIASLLVITGCSHITQSPAPTKQATQPKASVTKNVPVQPKANQTYKSVDFSSFDSVFRFSAQIPSSYEVEYVPGIRSINIYDPNSAETSVRDKSQIFIRFFNASEFLTLSTVDILEQTNTTRLGRDAVRYEIIKKSEVADFLEQPQWRNERHNLIDIRFSDISPTTFFVYSYNPLFPESEFEKFIDSIEFHNIKSSFVAPMDRFNERINKKPFGIYITPADSPVQPERFSGYHNAVDLEIFEGELDKTMMIKTICTGALRQIRTVNGYGGLIIQDCVYEGSLITVLYGHVDLDTVSASLGQKLEAGTPFVALSAAYSAKASGERKHLHLGIHKGSSIVLRGYETSQGALSAWLDPQEIIK